MRLIAERVIDDLLDGVLAILEDRLDDIVTKHGAKIPGSTPEAKRQTLEGWLSFDPSANKKYFPWMVKQFLTGKTTWDHHSLDSIRDTLMDFEHYITMPAFNAPRDVYQYDIKSLNTTVANSRGLTSKTDRLRGRKATSANVVSSIGDLELVGFKDGKSVAEESWRAYSADNPNWKGAPHDPSDPEYNKDLEPYSVDRLWCTRNPDRGANYIKGIPDRTFYIVRKNGWPYVAAVLGNAGSQVMDLNNHQINVGVAEEIYPLFKPVLDEYAKNKWNIGDAATTLFGLIRIVRGEIVPGETIRGADLSNSGLKSLPNDLTVNGNLNLSHTKITQLPSNLTVNGDLSIAGTAINELPPNLNVSGNLNLSGSAITALPQNMIIGSLDISNTNISQLPSNLEIKTKLKMQGTPITKLPPTMILAKNATLEYSAPLTREETRQHFFWLRVRDLQTTFRNLPANKSLTPEQQEVAWQEFIPKLQSHFQKDKTVDKAVNGVYKQVEPRR